VPGIEPRPPDLQPRTLTTRPQRRSEIRYDAFKKMHNSVFGQILTDIKIVPKIYED
jgi:hypothetical protein